MAYNALLDCDGNWEKLVYYGMLHGGDSDTVGAICGGLYGAVYGSKDVPEHLLKYLEMKEKLIELSISKSLGKPLRPGTSFSYFNQFQNSRAMGTEVN